MNNQHNPYRHKISNYNLHKKIVPYPYFTLKPEDEDDDFLCSMSPSEYVNQYKITALSESI